ncbi:Yvc1p SCDLUD_002930 [Saccharomycodes ludwigii]|uniref:Yvc1p n=1 Tax=Saccharomycodes ludwigii TaxID=36035 RepID=UPI001E8BADDE|nr:hypothetical protein SCDLUD_002930 [Saccharomycodes ludwigii]KAH3901437.1 hypothetical protein SCDLUD_002930 [Saccharomycodes ludwigii]
MPPKTLLEDATRDHDNCKDSRYPLLPIHNGQVKISPIPPNSRQVLRICINLKELIDNIIPIAFDENLIICDNSRILNVNVIKLAREACGGNLKEEKSYMKYQAVLIFCLLKVCEWYWSLAEYELFNEELHNLRATTAQTICKIILEEEEQIGHFEHLFINMLCRRYVINENDEDSDPRSAFELASDMHATIVISSSGYQRCLKWLWRGWIVQSKTDTSQYEICDTIGITKIKPHFHPERIKSPIYQNILEIFFSVVYLILFSIVVNSKGSAAVSPIDFFESLFYIFTVGFIYDEIVKIYHVGSNYLSFWNVFNDSMYTIIVISVIFRFMGLFKCPGNPDSSQNEYWDKMAYRILSCVSPLIWSRLLLYLDSQTFVGALLVVLKQMMKESLIFFFLLILIMLGFLQGFLGLDSADGKREITGPIIGNLLLTILGYGSFNTFENFAYPYAAVLYYSYCFIVTVILLNILIALYSTAYQNIIDNANNEYFALLAQKTLRFIRAPDENVYVPPLNLVELSLFPISYCLCRFKIRKWKTLHNWVMTFLYFPFLCYISVKEVGEAKRISYNRIKRLPDDSNEIDTPWNLTDGYSDENDDLFNPDVIGSIRANRCKNKTALKLQKEAENEDPFFNVTNNWHVNVKKSVQPYDKGSISGIGWENYALYERFKDFKKN